MQLIKAWFVNDWNIDNIYEINSLVLVSRIAFEQLWKGWIKGFHLIDFIIQTAVYITEW